MVDGKPHIFLLYSLYAPPRWTYAWCDNMSWNEAAVLFCWRLNLRRREMKRQLRLATG